MTIGEWLWRDLIAIMRNLFGRRSKPSGGHVSPRPLPPRLVAEPKLVTDPLYDPEAALVVLNPQFHCCSVSIEIGSCDERTVAHERALICKYRAWLADKPPGIVAAYEKWLCHFERNCAEAEKAVANNIRQQWIAKSERRSRDYDLLLERVKKYPRPDQDERAWR